MGSIKSAINSHNRAILRTHDSDKKMERTCNCRKGNECPLNGKCLEKNIIYKATVTYDGKEKDYIGSSGNTFKTRYGQHKNSFISERSKKSTELSKFIWELKDKNIEYKILWNIVRRTASIRSAYGCNLCNLERLEIANAKKERTLNKRTELQARCPHERAKYFADCKKRGYGKRAEK